MTRLPRAAALLLPFALTACSSSPPAPASLPPAATTAAAPATTTSAVDTSGLTGFGATQAAWDAHHTADPDKASGIYNPDPALPQTTDGKIGDEYDAVTTDDNGHVHGYLMAFTARPLAAALDRVKQELPADTQLGKPVVTSGLADSKCLVLTATSATLGKVMGGANGAVVEIELQSWSPTVLNQDAIGAAALVSGNSGTAPGC